MRKKGIVGGALLGAGFFLLMCSRVFPAFAQWYSVHIYPVLVAGIGRLTGIFPFSLSEVLLYALLIGIVVTGAVKISKIVRKSAEKGELFGWFVDLFLMAGVLFFLYVVNCGINYHRESVSEISGIYAEDYTADELSEVCLWLTQEVNRSSKNVKRNDAGVMELSFDAEEYAVSAMQDMGKIYEELEGYYPRPKGLLIPGLLSVQHLTGVYSPFTVEANYNSGMPDYNIPFTMCHELSHLRGFMQEEEANFLAFLACRASEKEEFFYSGNLTGWVYCMNVLYKVDYKKWEEVRGKLSSAVEADLAANRDFWARYDGTVAEVSNKVNDTYLKANGQDDGVKSYDRMVDLIVAYRRMN